MNPLAERTCFSQALLVGLKLRHGLDEQELAAAVGKALRKSRDHRTCEDCRVKKCSLGLPSEGHKRRWCAGCAKAHPGAKNVDIRKCEDCRLKHYLKRGTARSL